MKKSLLAVVALAATVCGAQATSFNQATKQARNFAPVEAQAAAETATDYNAAAKAPAKKASKTADELCGNYVWLATLATDTATTEGGSAVITKVSADSVNISGVFLGGDVTGYLNGDTIYIYPQQHYVSSTYGSCTIYRFTQVGSSFYYYKSSPIRAAVNADGTITVADMAGVRIDTGSYAGYRLGGVVNPHVIYAANGYQSVTYNSTYSKYSPATYAAAISQPDDSTVIVKNLFNNGYDVTFNLAADSTFTIAKQLVWKGGKTYGDFYTQACDFTKTGVSYVSDLITGDVISGKGTEDALSWGNCCIYSTTQYWTGAYETSTVTYANGTKFRYPSRETGVKDVNATKTAVATTYYNVAGQQSAQPFSGLNIVVTRFADGTTSASKVIK